jgi:hypothetical protein
MNIVNIFLMFGVSNSLSCVFSYLRNENLQEFIMRMVFTNAITSILYGTFLYFGWLQ